MTVEVRTWMSNCITYFMFVKLLIHSISMCMHASLLWAINSTLITVLINEAFKWAGAWYLSDNVTNPPWNWTCNLYGHQSWLIISPVGHMQLGHQFITSLHETRKWGYFLNKVNIWNVNCAWATAFIFDTWTDVLVKMSKFLRQKMARPEGVSNPQPSDSSPML